MIKPLILTILLILICVSYHQTFSQSLKRCARAEATCVLTPEVTEGPYYWNTSQMRQNIKDDRSGVSFRLQVVVMDVNTCSPIANAAVTLWHCDAMGIYSHYIQASQNVMNPQTDNSTFLRGIQLTNGTGVAMFDTIYPGWYIGRTTHMHVKVHLGGTYLNETNYYSGATYVHTGQLFFNDSLTTLVNQQSPYKNHTGSPMQNSQDNIYASTGGSTLMNVQYANGGTDVTNGLITAVTLFVRSTTSTDTTTTTTAASASVSPSNGGGNRMGGRPFWLW